MSNFINGAIGTQLPNTNAWKRGYDDDPEICLLREMITMPLKMIKENLLEVNSNYCGPLCWSRIIIGNNMIVLRKPLGSGTNS